MPILIALIIGALSAFAFQPVGWWPLMIVAIAALCELIARTGKLGSALLIGWAFGVGQFVIGLNWIATAFTYQAAMPAWLGWIAVLLLSLYLALYPAVAAGLAWRWGATEARPGGEPAPRGRGHPACTILAFAAAWIVTEWLRATLFTGFAWNPAAVALLPTPISRLAILVGTYGLSGIAMLLAGALLLLVRRRWTAAAALGLPPILLGLLL